MKRSVGVLLLTAIAMGTLAFGQTLIAAETPNGKGKAAAVKGNDLAPMGSPDFYPSSAHPIGWRGDGTGCYPGATPPTVWSRTEKGERKNILWEAKLPCYTWSTPIIVGDKIFVRSEPYDLICLNKNTGKMLWMRSHPAVIAVTDAEWKANPAFNDIAKLVADLQNINDQFAAQGWTRPLCQKKYDLQKKINDLTTKADKKYKLPPDQYVESWAGYTGATPCSDGQNVYVTSGNGITACYDLDGKKKWARYESVAQIWGEHGVACSPALSGDTLLVKTLALHALNKATGADIWTQNYERNNGANVILPFQSDGNEFALAFGNLIRVKDGVPIVLCPLDVGGGQEIIHGNRIFFAGSKAGYWTWSAKPTGELTLTPSITEEYNRVNLPWEDNPNYPIDKTISGFYTASPIFHDGLLYSVGNWGRLAVLDTEKTKQADTLVYTLFPKFNLRNGYSRKTTGMGICASPAFAGKYIYLLDSAGCVIVIEPGREYKEIAKNSIDETVPEAWEPSYNMGAHHEQTEASPIFDGKRMYLRGEQFLYCISEK